MNTFKEVENWYDSIKPLKSKHHKLEDDIRPIGARRRKHERIVKVNDDKYVLGVVGEYEHVSNENIYPLITWEREGRSREFVTICHGTSKYSNLIINFLNRYVPYPMEYKSQHIHLKGEKYYLPQSVGMWVEESEGTYVRKVTERREYLFERKQIRHDLVVWQLLTPRWLRAKKLVDKETKREYASAIRDFSDWACIMAPVLKGGIDKTTKVYDITPTPEDVRTILRRYDNTQRVDLLTYFMANVMDSTYMRFNDSTRKWEYPEQFTDRSKFKTQINNLVNTHCDFYKYLPIRQENEDEI
jgi:hypothetical protein